MIQRIRTWLASSIANRIGASSLALTLLVALPFGGASLFYTLHLMHDASQRELAHDSSRIAQDIIAKLENIDNELDILASNPVLLSGALDSGREQVYLKPIIESFQPHGRRPRMLCITDYRGNSLACTGSASETWQYTADAEAAIASGRVSASFDAAEKGQSGKLHIIMPLVYYQTGQAEGALAAEYDLDELIRDAAGGVGNVIHLNLKDRSGTDLFFKGSRSNIIQYNQTLALRPPFDKPGLSITVGADRSRIQEPLWRIGLIFLLLTLLFVPLIVLAARRLSLSVTHNLARLTEAVEQSTLTGHLPLNMPGAGADEVGRLSQAFAHMVRRVQETLDGLEHAVAERTGELAGSEERIRNMSDAAGAYLWEIDANMVYTYISSQSTHVKGHPPEALLGRTPMEFMPEEDIARVGEIVNRAIADKSTFRLQHRDITPAGEVWWEEVYGAVFLDESGKVTGLRGTGMNINERKQAEQALQLAASVFSTSREGIMITDTDGTIIEVNDAFTYITGFGHDDAVGKNPRILSSGRHGPEHYAAMWRDLKEKGHWYGEVWNRRKNGEEYAEMQTISTVRDAEGNAQQYVSLFSDITSIKEHQNQLENIAHYDALTGLPNRVLLADRLLLAMAQARRRKNVLAVAFLDLDGFKTINDHYGHAAGDALLIALSARMGDDLREGDTLARIGGDEFVAVLVDLSGVEDCVPMLGRLLAAAAEPVHVGELTLQVTASLGVTFYPQEEDLDADQLQRQADQAMYQAKLAGKNRYHVFDAAQDRSVRGHHEGIEDIRRALVEREFVLYYQPKVNLRSGAVVGAEALIRWQHPQKGLQAPAAFLPLIEDHPLAIEIGEWVIDSALTQMETWRAAGLDIPVSVNVGSRQLQQPDFFERLHALLIAHPAFRAGDLEIEVLETSALEDIGRVSTLIEACSELGVTFSLDDFGTGYSSLTYLKRLAVTVLKIDQSFVRDMLGDPDDLAILEGVIGLASAFRRVAIAEGVETLAIGEILLQLGCDLAQGYGIARPMPADQMPGWAAAWRTPPAWANCEQISHDNRPLLHAAVEHRAWIVAEENYIKGERAAPPPRDPHQCHFGLWLDAERLTGRGAQPGFSAIDTLHQQVHALAAELSQLRIDGHAGEAVARLGELYRLSDALLGQLKALETSRCESTAERPVRAPTCPTTRKPEWPLTV